MASNSLKVVKKQYIGFFYDMQVVFVRHNLFTQLVKSSQLYLYKQICFKGLYSVYII